MVEEKTSELPVEKVKILNTIIDDLIIDASELIKDLYSGVRTYLIFGMMTILFGVSELASNMEQLQERFYIPAFVAFCLIFCGVAQIIVYNRMRKKYAKLFEMGIEKRIL
jgi:uncharacterized membrane protein